MDSTKEKMLEKTYSDFLDLMLYDFPVERAREIVAEDVTGYGTTVDEKILEIKRLKQIVTDQREQGAGIEMQIQHKPVHRRISPAEDAAIYTDEFTLSMNLEGGEHLLQLRLSSAFEFHRDSWKLIHIHGSVGVATENDTWHKEEWKRKNEELQRLVDEKTADLEQKNSELEIEAALQRILAQVTAMSDSSDLFDIVVMMQAEFVKLGHEAHYFWHMRWLPDKYEKALTNGDGTRIGNVLELPRGFHGLQSIMDWEKSEEPSAVFALNTETAADYIDKMISLGRFQEIDHSAPGPDDVRAMGGLTFVMARTTHGEIGYTLPGEVPNPPEGDVATLVRFASVFDLAYRRFEDLQNARKALSDLKATQSQLIHAEKMASLGELTAGIAHEIQNPLNFVNNFSEVSVDLLDELEEEAEAGNAEEVSAIVMDLKQNLEKILHHGKRASGIVKGMLGLSRSGSGQKEATDINILADEYLRLAYHGLRAKDKSFNADFSIEADKDLPKIKVVGQDIGRVLLNLINNAFYAVSDKAKDGPEGFKPSVKLITKSLDDKIEIIVKDNGNGIPDKVLEKIFQPFYTTKPSGEGTGLGLSLSYEIITKGHGGELIVKTDEGEGAEFIITLPVKQN